MIEDREHDEEGPPPTYTPWLLVRATPSDMGDRPLPAGTPFWVSPDITVAPADEWGRVQAGDQVTVSVLVQNLGLASATGVRARFWWADPSTGISPLSATVIGSSDRVSIPAGQAEVLACMTPWVPVFVNGGHECLVVEVSSLSDPVVHTFRPDLDRRVGQRNVTVLGADGGTPIVLTVVNPLSREALTTLHVRTVLVFGFEQLVGSVGHVAAVDALLHVDDPSFRELFEEIGVGVEQVDAGAGLDVGEAFGTGDEAGGYEEETQRLVLARHDGGHDFGREVGSLHLPAHGVGHLEVALAPGGLSGAALVHHLTQVTDGVDVGGYGLASLPS